MYLLGGGAGCSYITVGCTMKSAHCRAEFEHIVIERVVTEHVASVEMGNTMYLLYINTCQCVVNICRIGYIAINIPAHLNRGMGM